MAISKNTEVISIYIIFQQWHTFQLFIIFESYHVQSRVSRKNKDRNAMRGKTNRHKKRQICIHLTGIAGAWIFMDMYSEVQIEMGMFHLRGKWWCSGYKVPLGLSRHYFFRGGWLLGLPEMVVDRHRIHASWHGLGWYLTELLLVRVVLVEAVDHLARDALGADAHQLVDLLRLGAVGVDRAELAAGISEQNQEVVGLRFLHFLLRSGVKSSLDTVQTSCTLKESNSLAIFDSFFGLKQIYY